jgi:hypothetical protein
MTSLLRVVQMNPDKRMIAINMDPLMRPWIIIIISGIRDYVERCNEK